MAMAKAAKATTSGARRIIVLLLVAASVLIFLSMNAMMPGVDRHGSASGKIEYSFLKALDGFLENNLGARSRLSMPWSGNAEALDEAMDGPRFAFPLRVYVYDMPAKFTTDLLRLFHDTYKETTNLTSNGSPVHRLIEQHSIDFWLYSDLLTPESQRLVKTVKRVLDPREADVFYIPFFTTISYFLLDKERCKPLYREALNWITNQPAWKRSGGRDHILPVHHPWSLKSVRRFMKTAIWLLPDLDSTGSWYKPGEVSLEKDIVLPYVPNVEICDVHCQRRSWDKRPTLLFFRGRTKRNAGGKIRTKLAAVLQGEAGVVVEEGSTGEAGRQASEKGMRRHRVLVCVVSRSNCSMHSYSSKFCLNPAGDTPSSARLFDAIVSGCVPVVVSDELEPPFEGILDYRKVALFVPSAKAVENGWLVSYLRNVSVDRLLLFRRNLPEFAKHFRYATPAQPLGPEDLSWQMVAGKIPSIRLHIRRAQRLVNGSRNVCSCDCKHVNSYTSV